LNWTPFKIRLGKTRSENQLMFDDEAPGQTVVVESWDSLPT
jgi:hypothetical protein